MSKEITPLPQQPTNIKTAHYYRLKRRLEKEIGLPMNKTFCEWLGYPPPPRRGSR